MTRKLRWTHEEHRLLLRLNERYKGNIYKMLDEFNSISQRGERSYNSLFNRLEVLTHNGISTYEQYIQRFGVERTGLVEGLHFEHQNKPTTKLVKLEAAYVYGTKGWMARLARIVLRMRGNRGFVLIDCGA